MEFPLRQSQRNSHIIRESKPLSVQRRQKSQFSPDPTFSRSRLSIREMATITTTTSPLAAVTSGQYEQAMIQGAVKKRITIFKHLQKTYSSNVSTNNRVVMKLENMGVILFFVQKMILKEYILSKKEFQRSLLLRRVC